MKFALVLALVSASAFAGSDQIFEHRVYNPDAKKVLVLVMPDMTEKVVAGVSFGGSLPNVGAGTVGVRGKVFAYKSARMAIAFEGIAAGYAVGGYGIFDMTDSWGGGFRVELPLASD